MCADGISVGFFIGGEMRPIVRERILKKCGSVCLRCGATESLEVDHIIPLTKGGRHDEDNMQILCKTCNLKKGNRVDIKQYFKIDTHPDYMEMSRDFPMSFYTPKEIVAIVELMNRLHTRYWRDRL